MYLTVGLLQAHTYHTYHTTIPPHHHIILTYLTLPCLPLSSNPQVIHSLIHSFIPQLAEDMTVVLESRCLS